MPPRLAVLALALVACDPAPTRDAGVPPPRPDGSVDAAGLDGGDGGDGDGGHSDAGPEAGVDGAVPSTCGASAGAPSWVVALAPHRVLAAGTTRRVEVTALADGVTRLRYLPIADDVEVPDRSFALVTPASELAVADTVAVGADDAGETLVVCTDRATVRVRRVGGRVTVTDAAGRVLVEDTDEAVGASAVARATPTSEPFYGLGEKTGGLDRRGRRWTFWNTDAYDPAFGGYRPDQDPLYASIPFFVALREGVAYGVFTDVAYRLTIDLAAATPEVYRVESEGPAIDQYVILGPRMQDVLRTYTGLTGRAPIPPRWALGFHQCRWGYSPDARVEAVGAEFRRRDIPADALWLDIQHMDGFRSF
ncbi:MAG: glycoside hydrolase family 31 protein, partial [Sandaracinaceae bacterium]